MYYSPSDEKVAAGGRGDGATAVAAAGACSPQLYQAFIRTIGTS